MSEGRRDEGDGTRCEGCDGLGEVHTGECHVAMSGPTCMNPNCPPCQTPVIDPCDECDGTGVEPAPESHTEGHKCDPERPCEPNDHLCRNYERDAVSSWTIRVCDECGFHMLERRSGGSGLDHAVHSGGDGKELRDTFRLVEVIPASEYERISKERDRFDDEAERLGIERAEAWAERDQLRAEGERMREALEAHRHRCYTQDEDGKWLAVDGPDAILYDALDRALSSNPIEGETR